MGQLDEILEKLRKKYGPAVSKGLEIKAVKMERVSTGSFALDLETGGGLPFGRIVEIFGREGSGKTTMALKTVANVQQAGKRAVWIDVEGALELDWAHALGVNVSDLDILRPQTGEEAVDMLEAVVRSNELGIAVLDSVAALMPMLELDKSVAEEPEKIGARALLMNRAMRRLHSALNTYDENSQWNPCLILLLNQIREKVGVVYGSPETTPGGLGIRFSSTIRIRFARGEWLERETESGEKVKIGHVVKFRTEKNKTFPPFRESQFVLYFAGALKGQIDTTEEVARYGQLYNIVKVSGRTYAYGELKSVGKDNFVAALRAEPSVVVKIIDEILKVALHQ